MSTTTGWASGFGLALTVATVAAVEPSGSATAATATVAAPAADPLLADPLLADPLFEATSDELLLFQDLAPVVSASRTATPRHLAATATDVVTTANLSDGLYTNLYEPLVFVPGMDVLTIDRNRTAAGVRGFHDTFSDRTLTLVDGRPADSPVFGGSEFDRLPLDLVDVERIEVVKGPSGGVWGANAFTGVVNIITRRPEDPTGHGLTARATASHVGDVDGAFRWADSRGDVAWRLTVAGERHPSSAHALYDRDSQARDDGWGYLLDGEVAWQPAPATTLRAGLGWSFQEEGPTDSFSRFPMAEEGRDRTLRGFVSLEQAFADGSTATVSYTGRWHDSRLPAFNSYHAQEHTLDAWYTTPALFTGHQLTVGGHGRLAVVDDDAEDPEDLRLTQAGRVETTLGVFADDRWTLRPGTVIEAQGRLDRYSPTGWDWSGRLAVIQSLDDSQHHTLRLALARGYRAPYSILRRLAGQRLRIGEFDRIATLPIAEVENEHTWSLESGYHGHLTEHLTTEIQVYFQRFDGLIGIEPVPVVSPEPLLFYHIRNGGGGNAYGGEVRATWRERDWEVAAWYAYHGFETDQAPAWLRSFRPAPHKAGAMSTWRPRTGLSFQLRYRFTDRTEADPLQPGDVPSSHRVDLDATWHFAADRGRLQVGVHDLFDDTGDPAGGIGDSAPHETPGRLFLARLEWRF